MKTKIIVLLLVLLFHGASNIEAQNKGIPGNRGIEHIGITVPNLKEAVNFFEDVLGAEFLFEIGPFASDDDWMNVHLNVHPRSKIKKATLLKLANGANLEIFEYKAPKQVKKQPKNSDIGGHHIGLYVDNMDEAVKQLKKRGVKINGEPVTMTKGPNAGTTWVYFMTPWGMQMELVSYPNGQAYEETTDKRAFTPAELSCTNKTKVENKVNEGISFYVHFYIKEEHIDAWKKGALKVLESMKSEDTFISAYLHADEKDPSHFTLYEKWSEPTMDAFIKNQLNGKAYRDEYEKLLPGWSKAPRTFSVLKPLNEWHK